MYNAISSLISAVLLLCACEPRNAADDVPGCERPVAFVANMNVFEGQPSWWAVDFSGCGPDPEPRLLTWESGDGFVCETEYDPIGMDCEIVTMDDCEKVAVDTWSATMWAHGSDSFTIGYEFLAGEDYTPDSALPCKAQEIGGETFWDCTGLPFQAPSCSPITAN